jgi:uncharacterized protein (TIGR02453 family)
MNYFNEDFLQFFKELAANNNKSWFDENRKRYEENIKEPFKKFVSDYIIKALNIDNELQITYKEAIFRINRDIRFSKDKTPYKTKMSAIISKYGRKDKIYPGVYFEMGPEHIRFYSGIYMADSKLLNKIRGYIAKNYKSLEKIKNDKKFVKSFIEILGQKNKVINKEFKAIGNVEPLMYNKQFYIYTQLAPEFVLDDKLMQMLLEFHKTASPFINFFKKAVS